MNLNLPSLIMFTAGGVLLYAAIKNKNPVDVIKQALGGEEAPSGVYASATFPEGLGGGSGIATDAEDVRDSWNKPPAGEPYDTRVNGGRV